MSGKEDKYLKTMREKLDNAENDLERIQKQLSGLKKDEHMLYGTIQGYVDAINTYQQMKTKGEI